MYRRTAARPVAVFVPLLRPTVADLVPVLERFASVESVHQMAPTGHVHKEPPRSLLECVAMVVCRSDDPQQMVEESDEILQQDLAGW